MQSGQDDEAASAPAVLIVRTGPAGLFAACELLRHGAGVRIRQVQLLGPGLQEIATTKFAGIGCKYEFQCSLPQWRTETILREHLQSLGVKIEYGTEVKMVRPACM
jgi:2-polyprenyl-6-methoxyphenol hydroxylase-like FAD-dependent oxidoreductase